MHADFAQMCADFEAVEANPTTAAGPTTGGIFDGLFMRLLSAWKAAGMKTGSFWAWLPVILQLVEVLGPKIMEIIAAIQEAINKGKTPSTFNVAETAAAMG